MVSTVAFLFFSVIVVVAAWRTVVTPNVVRAGLALVVVLASLAPIYLMLAAEFIAVVQILVYVGAVVILLLFAIMLTRSSGPSEQTSGRQRIAGFVVSAALFTLLIVAIIDGTSGEEVEPSDVGTTEEVGRLLLNDHVVAFEAISVLLLVTLIGAIVLARREPLAVEKGKDE